MLRAGVIIVIVDKSETFSARPIIRPFRHDLIQLRWQQRLSYERNVLSTSIALQGPSPCFNQLWAPSVSARWCWAAWNRFSIKCSYSSKTASKILGNCQLFYIETTRITEDFLLVYNDYTSVIHWSWSNPPRCVRSIRITLSENNRVQSLRPTTTSHFDLVSRYYWVQPNICSFLDVLESFFFFLPSNQLRILKYVSSGQSTTRCLSF